MANGHHLENRISVQYCLINVQFGERKHSRT